MPPACPGLRRRRSCATRAPSATTARTPPARPGSARSSATSSAGMDIEGAGWKSLEQLLQTGLVTKRGDFFRLSVEDIEALDRYGRKSAENLYANIQKAKSRPLERIIASLGHPPGRLDDGDRAGPLAGRGGARRRRWLLRGRRPPPDDCERGARAVRGDRGHRSDGLGGARDVVRAGRTRRGRARGPRRCRRRGGAPRTDARPRPKARSQASASS